MTQPVPRCGVAAQVGPCAAPGRLLGMARVAMGNAWCRPDADQGTPWKRRRCRRMDAFCEVRLGHPREVRRESRSWTAARCDRDALRRDGRGAGAVTEQDGAAIGVADATHGSAECRGGGRLNSAADAGSRRLPDVPFGICPPSLATWKAQTAAGSSRDCPQGEHVLLDGRRMRPNALRLVGRDESRPEPVSARRAYSRIGACTSPMKPTRWADVPAWQHAATGCP